MKIEVGDIFVERSGLSTWIRVIKTKPGFLTPYFIMTVIYFGHDGEVSSFCTGYVAYQKEFDTMKYGFKVEEPNKCVSEPSL